MTMMPCHINISIRKTCSLSENVFVFPGYWLIYTRKFITTINFYSFFQTSLNVLIRVLITWKNYTFYFYAFFFCNCNCCTQVTLKLTDGSILLKCIEMRKCMRSNFLVGCSFYLFNKCRGKMVNFFQFILFEVRIWIILFLFICRSLSRQIRGHLFFLIKKKKAYCCPGTMHIVFREQLKQPGNNM